MRHNPSLTTVTIFGQGHDVAVGPMFAGFLISQFKLKHVHSCSTVAYCHCRLRLLFFPFILMNIQINIMSFIYFLLQNFHLFIF